MRSPAVRLEIVELALRRVVIEPAQCVDAHDHRDHEQDDRALAAVIRVRTLPPAIEPDAGAEQQHRGGKLDHARRGHSRTPFKSPWNHAAPRNSSIAVAAIISRRPKRRAWSTLIS